MERASIDEAYLDLTEEVAKLCRQIENGKGQDLANAPEMDLQVKNRTFRACRRDAQQRHHDYGSNVIWQRAENAPTTPI